MKANQGRLCTSNILMFEINRRGDFMKIMDAQEIMEIIPNRYPICYVDYVDELEDGKRILATKNVTINESYFRGHFPGNPVMPGVLIIETLAQVASILILKSKEFQNKTAYLGAIHKAKFKRMVRPGDVLKLETTITKTRENMGMVDAKAYVDGKVVCSAELMFIVSLKDEQVK